MMVPRGRCSAALRNNYMAYVRGNPGDSDGRAAGGARGGLRRSPAVLREERGRGTRATVLDTEDDARKRDGGLGVSVRTPRPVAATVRRGCRRRGIPRATTMAATAAVLGRASLFRDDASGKAASTYPASLEAEPERENLTVIAYARSRGSCSSIRLGAGRHRRPVPRRPGRPRTPRQPRGRPQRGRHRVIELLLSGIGPGDELEAVGLGCRVDTPHVGRH